jgi:hypothetical protein
MAIGLLGEIEDHPENQAASQFGFPFRLAKIPKMGILEL